VTQAANEATTIRRLLLTPADAGGQLATWDRPNGWAPMQWVVGFRLAEAIAVRWSCHNLEVYRTTGARVEKFNLSRGSAGLEENLRSRSGSAGPMVLRELEMLYPSVH